MCCRRGGKPQCKPAVQSGEQVRRGEQTPKDLRAEPNSTGCRMPVIVMIHKLRLSAVVRPSCSLAVAKSCNST